MWQGTWIISVCESRGFRCYWGAELGDIVRSIPDRDKSNDKYKRDVTPLLTHWSYVSFALIHYSVDHCNIGKTLVLWPTLGVTTLLAGKSEQHSNSQTLGNVSEHFTHNISSHPLGWKPQGGLETMQTLVNARGTLLQVEKVCMKWSEACVCVRGSVTGHATFGRRSGDEHWWDLWKPWVFHSNTSIFLKWIMICAMLD